MKKGDWRMYLSDWYARPGPVQVMAVDGNYVMVRRPGRKPFVVLDDQLHMPQDTAKLAAQGEGN